MKNTIFFCLLCFLYGSCTFNKKEFEKSFFVTPKENIFLVLDSFVRANNCDKDCVFEIYVDKQLIGHYLLFIYSGKQSLTENDIQVPIMHTVVSGVKFDIYSGVENYFEIDYDSISMNKTPTIFSDEGRCVWVVTDSFGIITVQDYYFAYPFVPLPGNTERYFNPDWWKESEMQQ
jgi:hypothetical protein